jgi:adenine-specific DNA methylase
MSGVFNAPLYGMTKWAYLFSFRQLVAICTLSQIISELRIRLENE